MRTSATPSEIVTLTRSSIGHSPLLFLVVVPVIVALQKDVVRF
jgi:hypothetical protein